MSTTTVTTKWRKKLEVSAMESATLLGHKMTPFATLHEQSHLAESVCEKCEAPVLVNARAGALGIAIGGQAVSLQCRDLTNVNPKENTQ